MRAEETQGLEAELQRLAPRADLLDGHRLMYLAGRAAAMAEHPVHRSPNWAWPLAFSLPSALAGMLAAVLLLRTATGPQVLQSLDEGRRASAKVSTGQERLSAQTSPNVSAGTPEVPDPPAPASPLPKAPDPGMAATAPDGRQPVERPLPNPWAGPSSPLARRARLLQAAARAENLEAEWARIAAPAEPRTTAFQMHPQAVLTPWAVRSAHTRGLLELAELPGGPGS